jgi:hypothetical protein
MLPLLTQMTQRKDDPQPVYLNFTNGALRRSATLKMSEYRQRIIIGLLLSTLITAEMQIPTYVSQLS